MAVKIFSVRLNKLDADAIGSMYVELNKLPCVLVGFSKDHSKMFITCQEHRIESVKKVVTQYV